MNKFITGLLCSTLMAAGLARAAIVTLEDFSSDPGGDVTNVDTNNNFLTASWNAGGSMNGTFASQGVASPEEDGFSITLAAFTGDYTTAGITQIAFDFYGDSFAPSYLFLNIVDDGANVFSYQFTDLTGITPGGGFTTFTADLVYSAGWTGAGSGAFTTALGSVNSIEVFFGRNGSTSLQEYRLDNLETLTTPINGGGGPSAVPEPNTLSFIAMIAAGGLAWRRRLMNRTVGYA